MTGRQPDRPASHRIFIAIPLPDAAIRDITEIVEATRAAADPAARDVRWVRLEGLHLTLRFIGQAETGRVEVVASAVARAAARIAPFDVAIEGAGSFPTTGRPRVLWLGVTSGAAELTAAAAALHDELAAAGIARDDRAYRAHLTVARADGIATGADVARRLIVAAEGRRTTFSATEMILFETVPGGGPARYRALRIVALAGTGARGNEASAAESR
ncbi:MAG: RNA 2',3'-cyclic phosphodiesterase [Chloroflexota bacterium]